MTNNPLPRAVDSIPDVLVRRAAQAILFCAMLFLFAGNAAAAIQNDIVGPAGSGQFGSTVNVLPNGNIVVSDPFYDAPGPVADVGAIYLYNSVGTLISSLTGTAANDRVGSGGIAILANGNYVVRSPFWNNGSAAEAGAVTWCSATAGCSGTVSAQNSLVGETAGDQVGGVSISILRNGHYVVRSSTWDNGGIKNVGAVTWCNGTTGRSGVITSANSLVGSVAEDQVGSGGFRALPNGNYVVSSSHWHNGATVDAGAVTWCNGTTGCVGPVTTANSLHGSSENDRVGVSSVVALTNSNYVVRSRYWNNGPAQQAGAATWCNGSTGCTGPISAANSLVGTTANDGVGAFVEALKNGNYVVIASSWDNAAATDAGAVTWCDGTTGRTGTISPGNSLVGTTTEDMVGSYGVAALTNGNYVVNSPTWDDGATADVGAVTWCNGTAGCIGSVGVGNSLIGTTQKDMVGTQTTALSNGHYIVQSSEWNNGPAADAGAVTWCNGVTGCKGVVSAANSLIGEHLADRVGSYAAALTNGHYVIGMPDWDNGGIQNAGAATWCDGTAGCTGTVSISNSLVGTANGEQISRYGLTALANGNYTVGSDLWGAGGSHLGAVTWCSGASGCTGSVSAMNSLVGSTSGDRVGAVLALPDGNYMVESRTWDDGAISNAGATTLGRGDVGTTGIIDASNSVRGATVSSGDFQRSAYDPTRGQLVVGRPLENIVTRFPARGPDLIVTTTDDHDDGSCSAADCTLREAIVAANALADDNTIRFAPGVGGTIQLTQELPVLTSNVTVEGPGANVLTVRRNSGGDYRILTISNGTVNGPTIVLAGLKISNGQAPALMPPWNSGGGIMNDRGRLFIRGCTISGNRSHPSESNFGGGVFNYQGSLTIDESTITENIATDGGGIASVRTTAGNALVIVRNSTFSGNSANGGSGGGIFNEGYGAGSMADLSLINSTLSGNSATNSGFLGGAGAAIYNFGSTSGTAQMSLQDCTITGNNAPSGGVYNRSFSASAFLSLNNTILNTGTTGPNFINADGVITSLGNNICNDSAGGLGGTGPGGYLTATSDVRNTDPLLGPLKDNGGPSFTAALLNGSPAIDKGINANTNRFDQRGFTRAGTNDIGAFEFGGSVPPSPTPTPSPTATPGSTASPTPNATATPSASPTPATIPSRFANISTRLRVESGENVLIGGFILTGTTPKKVLVRGIGPSLPLAGTLQDPILELRDGGGALIQANDNWGDAVNKQEIIDTTIPPAHNLESAIVATLPANNSSYTAIVRGVGDGAGVGVVEIYDLDSSGDSKLANISTRGLVQTADNVLIAGTIVLGSQAQNVIVRAIGPSLPVSGKLENPSLELRDSNGVLLEENDNWVNSPNKQAIIDSTVAPANDLESAIVRTLTPAAYTAIVRGVNDTTGIAVVEVYALQ